MVRRRGARSERHLQSARSPRLGTFRSPSAAGRLLGPSAGCVGIFSYSIVCKTSRRDRAQTRHEPEVGRAGGVCVASASRRGTMRGIRHGALRGSGHASKARASLVRLRASGPERKTTMYLVSRTQCTVTVLSDCSLFAPRRSQTRNNKYSKPTTVQMARMPCGDVSMSMSMSSMSAMLHVHARETNALFDFQAVRSGRLKSGPRRSSPFLAPLAEGLKQGGVSAGRARRSGAAGSRRARPPPPIWRARSGRARRRTACPARRGRPRRAHPASSATGWRSRAGRVCHTRAR